jgi:cytochrome c peroxidase
MMPRIELVRIAAAAVCLLCLLGLGAAGMQRQSRARSQAVEAALRQVVEEAGLAPLTPVAPSEPAQVRLGRALFFEKELSGNRDIACATCHDPALALSDGLVLAVGTGGSGAGPQRLPGAGRQFVPRNTPDLSNRGLPEWTVMFWDGRLEGTAVAGFASPAAEYLPPGLDNVLAAQAMLAVTSRHEMRGGVYDVAGYLIQPGEDPQEYQTGGSRNGERPLGWSDRDIFGEPNELAALGNDPQHMPLIWEQLMVRLRPMPAYRMLFALAYPGQSIDEMDFTYAANALAAFQADAFTFTGSPWDRYLAGDGKALTATAKEGALLFYGRAGCGRCHSGGLLTDQQYHNIAAPQLGPGTSSIAPLDYGRSAVTGRTDEQFAFRTPSLRNVTLTGPWLHNGAYDTLEDAVRHHLDPAGYLARYDGANLPRVLHASLQNEPVTGRQLLAALSPFLVESEPLSNREVRQLLAFLESLTDPAAARLDYRKP